MKLIVKLFAARSLAILGACVMGLLTLTMSALSPPALGAAPDVLVHEGVVAAPVALVWAAFTTREGQESWMVAHSDIELKVGGRMRTHYDPKGVLGDAKTIENTVLSFDAPRMMSIQVSKVPEGFPFSVEIKAMWTVIYFTPSGPDATVVRIVSQGFAHDEKSQKMRAYFDGGNAYTLKKLQQRFSDSKWAPKLPP